MLNIYVTYFLMLSTSKLSGVKISRKRLFITSILGGVFSLVIVIDVTIVQQMLIKLIMGVLLVVIGFYQKLKPRFQIVKSGIYFFMVNFIYGGVMLSIYMLFAPKVMAYKNGVVYFNITALNLVVSTIIAYVIVNVIIRILDKRISKDELAQIKINFLGREVILIGLIDTGNKLNDIFTGLPVVVCEYDGVKDLFPQKLQRYFQQMDTSMLNETKYTKSLRLVPVTVVGAELVLPAFKPEEVLINGEKREIIIAVTNQTLSTGEFNAII